MAIVAYALMPVDIGFLSYGIREIARDGEKLKKVTGSIISSRLLMSFFSFIVTICIIFGVYRHDIFFLIAGLISLLQLFSYSFDTEVAFIAKKNLLIPAISHLGGQIIYLLLVFLLIRTPDDLIILSTIFLSYQLIYVLLLFLFYRKIYGTLELRFSFAATKNLIKKSYKIGISNKIESFASFFPVLTIVVILDEYQLGLFSGARVFYTVIVLFSSSLMMVIAPYLVDLAKKQTIIIKKYLTFLIPAFLGTGILLSFVLYQISGFFIPMILGDRFNESISLFKAFLTYCVPFVFVGMFVNSVLLYFGWDSQYLLICIITSISVLFAVPAMSLLWNVQGTILAIGLSNLIYSFVAIYFLWSNISKNPISRDPSLQGS